MCKNIMIIMLLCSILLVGQQDFLEGVRAENLELERIEVAPAQTASEVQEEGFGFWFGKKTFTAYSPDSTMVADLIIAGSRSHGIRIVNTETRQEEIIAEGIVQNIKWSSDSRYIAFYKPKDNRCVWVYDFEDRQARFVSFGTSFAWSPQGHYLAGEYFDPEGQRILAVYDAKEKETGVIDRVMFCEPWNFSWSPNSEMLTYVVTSKASGHIEHSPIESEVFVINRDGTGKTRITNTVQPEILVKWLPDGKRILVERFINVPDTVYGGGEKELVILSFKQKERK